jgi:Ribonuclease G/E
MIELRSAVKLMIRGIYSTALIKLLLSNGFAITRPTRSQSERFDVSSRDPPDAEIVDSTSDRNCVEIKGSLEVVESVISTLRRSFADLIVLRVKDVGSLLSTRIGFPNDAKLKLDELRSEVAYTVPYHHYCRAGGEGLSSMVTIAEDLVEKGVVPAEEMSKNFREQVLSISPRIGSTIKIIHLKPDGRRIILGRGKAVGKSDGSIRLMRRIMGFGVYDGLEVEKRLGDYAITEVSMFWPWMKTSYYSISGTLKGCYYNISTPVSIYPDHIHYFDLELDVVVKPGSSPEIVDADGLEKAFQENRISEELKKAAFRIAEEIASKKP